MEVVIQDYHIRDFRPEDARDLQKILGDPAVMRYIEPPFTLAQTAAFLQAKGLDTPRRIYALADENDRVVGQLIFHPYEGDAWEIGWIIRQDCWGQGIASAVTKALIAYCREQSIRQCVIECHPEQTVTRHIAEKCGFSRIEDQDGLARYSLTL